MAGLHLLSSNDNAFKVHTLSTEEVEPIATGIHINIADSSSLLTTSQNHHIYSRTKDNVSSVVDNLKSITHITTC